MWAAMTRPLGEISNAFTTSSSVCAIIAAGCAEAVSRPSVPVLHLSSYSSNSSYSLKVFPGGLYFPWLDPSPNESAAATLEELLEE
jgi:hypothetical protein